ncbi:hypothetical protein D6851_13355 [Altericroceibacterium spongiae]|uniref:Lipoprotein n=1 Tax=Altericroceibacterium spongiae TaxID=2320269 RepID=A0A420EEC3_9SPHN|nr:hypothetical protein [Altericroceibacterium spongiae]RKF19006.1 hypothetical protein D6851_13355 [Altericroceibacterium spongiae]
MRLNPALCLLPLLAACASSGGITGNSTPPPSRDKPIRVPPTRPAPPPPAKRGFEAPQVLRMAGLEDVILKDSKALIRLFGPPRLDVHEGDMQKLQFAGSSCVLDIYLYPTREGAEPVATYVDARRQSDGLDVDRAACVKALRR